jgi:uridine phosphorylase
MSLDLLKHVYHLPRDLTVHVDALLCGSNSRVRRIAAQLDGAETVCEEPFLVINGRCRGRPLTVAGCGIGAPSASIAFQELIALGVRRAVRVGSSGRILRNLRMGDILIVTGAVRRDGVSHALVPEGIPALPSPEVVRGLKKCAEKLAGKVLQVHDQPEGEHAFFMGVADTKVEFFIEIPELSAFPEKIKRDWEDLARLGVAVSSMESAALFIKAQLLSHLLGETVQVGTLLEVVGDAVAGGGYASEPDELERIKKGEALAIRCALDYMTTPAI